MSGSMVKPVGVASATKSAFGRRVKAVAALGVLAASLAGCVVYPNGGYGGYAPGYYAPPVVGSVVVGGGWGWGGGWRGGWGGGWGHGWR